MNNNETAKTSQTTELQNKSKFGTNASFATREAFNLLRTNVMFSFADKEDGSGKIIGVTSSVSGDGKTNVSINLAYSLAEAGHKTLIIEGDMRRPAIAKYLQVQPTVGLSEFLLDGEKKVIQKGVLHENLSLIMSGESPMNPSVLLDSDKMVKALEQLSQSYDYIVIDMPPVIAVPDAVIMSKYIDGVLFVVRHNYTKKHDIAESLRQLKYTKVRVLGFVYNGFDDGKKKYFSRYGRKGYYYRNYSNYGYGRGYGYGYGYGYGERRRKESAGDKTSGSTASGSTASGSTASGNTAAGNNTSGNASGGASPKQETK